MLRLVSLVRPKVAPPAAAEDELWPLANAAISGDAVALRTLLMTLAPHMLRVLRRVLGFRHPELEDIAQECAIEFASALLRFRREASVKHFACRVALQTAMNARRKMQAGKRNLMGAEFVPPEDVAGASPLPETHAAWCAGVSLVRELCDELPEAQSEVLALHCVLGYSVSEVAAICGVPLETVRSRLRVAKQVLVARAQANPVLRELLEETV
jgi:RNA polymerase sigma-70 factor (ECF subfamily)